MDELEEAVSDLEVSDLCLRQDDYNAASAYALNAIARVLILQATESRDSVTKATTV
jgi:hypothetical protein